MTSLKTSIKTITYLSDIGCLEIQGASLAWQTTVYTKVNNFKYGNHKKTATENAFVLQYKMSPVFTPYIEYDYLDKQGVYKGKDNKHENSYRVGVLINF